MPTKCVTLLKMMRPFGRAKNVKEIDPSAICGKRKQAPRFDVSRWNYGVVIESMGGRPLLGVQEVPRSNHVSATDKHFQRQSPILPLRSQFRPTAHKMWLCRR